MKSCNYHKHPGVRAGKMAYRRAANLAWRTCVLGQCVLRTVGRSVCTYCCSNTQLVWLTKSIGKMGGSCSCCVLKLNDKEQRKNRGWREKPKAKREINRKPCWQTAPRPSPCQTATATRRGLPACLCLPSLQGPTPADINLVVLLADERNCVFSHSLFSLPLCNTENCILLLFQICKHYSHTFLNSPLLL